MTTNGSLQALNGGYKSTAGTSMDRQLKPTVYKKHHSFDQMRSTKASLVQEQCQRALSIIGLKTAFSDVGKEAFAARGNFQETIKAVETDLRAPNTEAPHFEITQFIAEEMRTYDDDQILKFLYHRYRYDLFPQLRRLDEYPPYLQIEPSSLCNYRCVFCYQTDLNIFSRKNPAMGMMTIDTYRRIIDAATGNVEFISLASRGEPTMARELPSMLAYSAGRFLNLKLNTNASLLTERLIHAILGGGVRTVVFSADAATEPLYSQLRVNGKLDRVLKNIDLFHKIRSTQYSDARVITRVSGVKVSEEQSMDEMDSLWGGLVDQVAFVNYNPWENIYTAQPNEQKSPCSDLWRRLFVWHDGRMNPCDSDYASKLSVGSIDADLSSVWLGEAYASLRRAHEQGMRQIVEPCRRCAVV